MNFKYEVFWNLFHLLKYLNLSTIVEIESFEQLQFAINYEMNIN